MAPHAKRASRANNSIRRPAFSPLREARTNI
jgi:hypothetical protein